MQEESSTKIKKRSNTFEVVSLLENISEENTMELVLKMHEDKMKMIMMMESFLDILKKKVNCLEAIHKGLYNFVFDLA